jgi:hypothetical protein
MPKRLIVANTMIGAALLPTGFDIMASKGSRTCAKAGELKGALCPNHFREPFGGAMLSTNPLSLEGSALSLP